MAGNGTPGISQPTQLKSFDDRDENEDQLSYKLRVVN